MHEYDYREQLQKNLSHLNSQTEKQIFANAATFEFCARLRLRAKVLRNGSKEFKAFAKGFAQTWKMFSS